MVMCSASDEIGVSLRIREFYQKRRKNTKELRSRVFTFYFWEHRFCGSAWRLWGQTRLI